MEDSRPQDQFMRSNATQTPDADADADADGSYDVDGDQIHDQGTARLRASVGEELGVFLCGQSENICADLSEFLEGNALDLEFDCEQDLSQQLREYTLRQWIRNSKPDISHSSAESAQSSANYIQSALIIALKLTECILEAEKDEQNGLGNPIPLDSITIENVVIRARKGEPETDDSDDARENIEFVWVMSFVGDDSAAGSVMARLFAVGKVLYELFSTAELIAEDDLTSFQMASLDSINISNDDESELASRKKNNWRSAHRHADNWISNYIAGLESTGVSLSLCSMVKNLLECRHDPFCDDDVYASFEDLKLDLQMMLDNPSSFLDDMHIINHPKLAIPDKLFGRDEELSKLDELYQSHINSGPITGVVISGPAGAGKSRLALHLQKVTTSSNGYYLSAKFEEKQMSLKPLSTITNLFDTLCEMVFNDSSTAQLTKIEKKITNVIGSQSNLLGIAPCLRKLMPSCVDSDEFSSSCVDSAVSMRYQLCEVLCVISSHSKPITLVIDDIQFADRSSLLLVGNLLFSAQEAPIFFCLCHRDDEVSMSGPFKSWLQSVTMFALESIKVGTIAPEAVNNLISEALHLSPRLTRPLSTMLHHKTRGCPLFLTQLLDSLTEQGYIFVDLKQRRWSWDLDKITELEISESVLALLMSDIKRLPSDLQFGLQVAACIGACITGTMFDYFWKGLGLNLKEILQQVAQRGFMINIAGSTKFRFSHDKIQQAAYELMPEQQRRENHMRFGLALCTQSLDSIDEDDELFFAAVNQINLGGPAAVQEPSQRKVMAELNLKAGRRSIELSDYNNAFTLFEYGISFLGDDDWTLNYQLSLDLHDAVAEVALILNKLSALSLYSNVVFSCALCFDDKLHCLITTAKALGTAHRQDQSIEASFAILLQCGEDLPREMGDDNLRSDIDKMSYILQASSDDMICNMKESNDKRMTILINLYVNLAHILQYFKPGLVASVSLRAIDLTLKTGLSPKSPLSFAHFGGVLSSIGYVNEGCRLGKLALKLVEKKGSVQFKSSVICFVYDRILWATEPLQSLVEAHLLGNKAGQQSGDIVFAFKNQALAILIDYFAGQNLDTVRSNIMNFLSKLEIHGLQMFSKNPALLLSQVMVLKDGLHMADVAHAYNVPSEKEILADVRSGPAVFAQGKLNHLTRAFLFRQMNDVSCHFNKFQADSESLNQLNPNFLFGYFFEGLASFQLARGECESESAKWIDKGQSVLTQIECRSEHSLWNWENKVMLLEAESLFTNGDFDRAGPLYDSAIRSAREHKFIHEEAIASELAGNFYYARGFREQSYSYLLHSINRYRTWGAHAVAKRVEAHVGEYFETDQLDFKAVTFTSLDFLFELSQGSEEKREGGH